jgi:hypothetical protein
MEKWKRHGQTPVLMFCFASELYDANHITVCSDRREGNLVSQVKYNVCV